MNVSLARKWAAVPGVKYPDAMHRLIFDNRCVTKQPSRADWISATELAKRLNISAERANAVGVRADKNFKVYVDPRSPARRTRYFNRSKVADIYVPVSEQAKEYERTHVPLPEAISILGKGRNAVVRLVEKGLLNPVRVRGGGKRGIFYMYSKKELEQIKKDNK